MHRTRLLSISSLLVATFAPAVAHALPSTQALPPPVGLDGAEPVTDLGDYDPNPAPHAAYGISKLSPALLKKIGTELDLVGCPAPQATYDWDRVFSKSDDFGNDTFGAGYWAGITVSSRAGRAGGPDSFSAEGLLKGYVTIFSTNKELARISGKASLVGSQGTSSYYVRVLGVDVRSKSISGNLAGNESLYDASFFSQSKTIWLGPVPVTFKAAVRGNLGISYQAQYATSTIGLQAKPTAKLFAQASAGVDLFLASAGVSGSLTLIQADVPSKASIVVQPNSSSYSVDSDLTLSSLSGQIDAYATLAGKKWRMCLASWDPVFSGTYAITHLSSCENPIVRPVCGDGTCQSGESSYNCATDCGAPPPPPPSDDPPVPPLCRAKPWMCN